MQTVRNYSTSNRPLFLIDNVGKPAIQGQPYSGFIDPRMQDALDRRDTNVLDFFKHLAVCQTVRPEVADDGTREYQAQSPDEKALVEAARYSSHILVHEHRVK